jgi:hypothetical protein
VAVIVDVPTGNFVVLIVAVPPLNTADPNVRVPFLNVTVPVGPPASPEATVAVSVTGCGKVDGLGLEVTVVVEGYGLTVSVSALAPVRWYRSPANDALIAWPPFLLKVVVKVATPPTVVDVPNVVVPSVNVTWPPSGTGGAEVEVAVKVTGWPNTAGLSDDTSWVMTSFRYYLP